MKHGTEIVGERVGASVTAEAKRGVLRNPEPERFCKECSKPVPPNRTIDGRPSRGSMELLNADPDRLFCTMKCAARFAVAAWNKYRAPR